MTDAIPQDSYREDLAKASTPERLWNLLSKGCDPAVTGARDDEVFTSAARLAQASYYVYLLQPTLQTVPPGYEHLAIAPDELLDQARLLVPRILDRFLASVALFKIALARHRLARNRWESDSIANAATEIDAELTVLRKLGSAMPSVKPDIEGLEAAWRFERAHVARYQGFSERSKAEYDATQSTGWVQPGTYREEVTAHYLVSLPCEWFVLHLLTFRALTEADRDAARNAADQMLGYIEQAATRCRTGEYGILGAHHAKHAAVCHAILAANPGLSDAERSERLAMARGKLCEAREFFALMGLEKPLLICELFNILIDALEQPADGVADRLLTLADRAKSYYPRVAFDALVFARVLGQVLDDSTGVVGQSEQAIADGGFLANPLRDRQRERLYRTITGFHAA